MDYETVCAQLEALTADVPYEIANLANGAALLWQFLPDINWAGFYLRQYRINATIGIIQQVPSKNC